MSSATPIVRKLVFVLFIAAIATAAILLFGTERGQELLNNPHHHGHRLREWVANHRIIAPVIYMSLFIALGILLLPVFWLQIIAGSVFGLTMGIGWSIIAATLSAVGAAAVSRYLAIDWFHDRIESHAARLKKLDDKLGHNGLMIVSLVRLAHFVPFGPSNALFGITRVSFRDVALGTFLGGLPTVTILVTAGADPDLLHLPRFWITIGVVNVVLLGAIALRYLWPQWFRKFGVE